MKSKYKLLIFFLIIPCLLLSQNEKNYFKHYFGGSSAGGFSMMPHLSLEKLIVLGGQWTGAFVYEVKRARFLFNTGL